MTVVGSAKSDSETKRVMWFTISGWIGRWTIGGDTTEQRERDTAAHSRSPFRALLVYLLAAHHSALSGTALFTVVYEWLHSLSSSRPTTGLSSLDALEWSTVAWTVAYLLSIVWQHALHRHLVFGTSSPYWSSLFWTYASYTLSIVLSAVINHALVAWIGLHHRISFGLTLIITGVINYRTLKNAFGANNTTDERKQG